MALELSLYEELVLLALREDKGTPVAQTADLAIAAGIVTELLGRDRLDVSEDGKATVSLRDPTPTGDAALDAVLARIGESSRQYPLGAWVQRVSEMRDLRELATRRLVEAGVLEERHRRILGIVPTTRYPEVDPEPERALVARLQAAIFDDAAEVDERTCLLVAMAEAGDLLTHTFGRRQIRERRERIEALAADERIAGAMRQAVTNMHAALVAISVAVTASTTAT